MYVLSIIFFSRSCLTDELLMCRIYYQDSHTAATTSTNRPDCNPLTV
jgi:hypothetical protein